ncbi:Serine/threonine protein kinase [Streptomyces zhaozhouensis]|uniref:Serine/threonine protein kinase n=1 Tax=Streptomyces zhaozhouensis TaxID=1300267 RepID=A0A286DWK4_9ACTN|nr:Serine/threonine protein kinase [Streptomyces zhaozhouensis]
MEPLRAGDPERVGGFVLRGRLGAGGMGEVFLGRSAGGRSVAVKVVYPHLAGQREFRARFAREVAAAETVSGTFTAPVVAVGPEDDPPWIATAYVPGPDLALAVAETGPLPESAVWGLAAGLVEALQAIHAKGLLHRDLKPSNVLLAADGPRVIDFGIARTLEGTSLTGTGAVIGTPGFMSPEQAQGGQIGPASDVFALGAVIAYAATGREPFGVGAPLAVLHRVLHNEPRLEALAGPLHAVVAACLAKSPGARPSLPQLLTQITGHWDPPDDGLTGASLWPTNVTTLIPHRATTPTAPYTRPANPPHDTPTTATTTPTTEELTHRFEEALRAGEAGNHAEAARLFAQLAADQARLHGDDHPHTLNTRYHHAWYTGDTGADSEAARLFAELAADQARVLGDDHPHTLNARRLHAHVLGRSGEHARAARLLAGVVVDYTRVLGLRHRHALTARHNHAFALGRAGEHAEAARLFAGLVVDYARVLGADHPHARYAREARDWNLERLRRRGD